MGVHRLAEDKRAKYNTIQFVYYIQYIHHHTNTYTSTIKMKLIYVGLAATADQVLAQAGSSGPPPPEYVPTPASPCLALQSSEECIAYGRTYRGVSIGPGQWENDQCITLIDYCGSATKSLKNKCLDKYDDGCIWNKDSEAKNKCEVRPTSKNCRINDKFSRGCVKLQGCVYLGSKCCDQDDVLGSCPVDCESQKKSKCRTLAGERKCTFIADNKKKGIAYECRNPSDWTAGGIELVEGEGDNSGRIELLDQYSARGTVCNDKFDDNAAGVICKQLGYNYGGLVVNYARASRKTPIVLDDLVCDGSESSWTECEHEKIGRHDCDHSEDIGVFCHESDNLKDVDCSTLSKNTCKLHESCNFIKGEGDDWTCKGSLTPESAGDFDKVELIFEGESHAWKGRVEVVNSGTGERGTVCDDSFYDDSAKVICRHMCLTGGRARREDGFGEGTGKIVLDELDCQGHENKWWECTHDPIRTSDCSHSEDISVICNPPAPVNHPYQYVFYTDSLYKGRQYEAVQFCLDQGGEIPSAGPAGNFALLQAALLNYNADNSWLSSTRNDDGVLTWDGVAYDDASFDASAWNPGEPNNWSDQEDCVELRGDGTGLNDISCDDLKYFVCQFDVNKTDINETPDWAGTAHSSSSSSSTYWWSSSSSSTTSSSYCTGYSTSYWNWG